MGGERRPAFQFYPDDWRSDLNLQVCSLAARGLWIECMALMHVGTPYGHLRAAGVPITTAMLAKLVGSTVDEVEACLAELAATTVYSTADDGAIYSRRMVADAEKAAAYRAGKRRAGRAGAAKRWQSDGTTHGTGDGNGMAEGMAEPWHEDGSPSPSPTPSPSPSPSPKEASAAVHQVLAYWAKHKLRPNVQALSDNRRQLILARFRQHGMAAVMAMLANRKDSRFLTFEYGHGRGAGIDWCFGPNNFVKVLDGNYNDGDQPAEVDEWCYDCYRQACRDTHGRHVLWAEYVQWTGEQPHRTAPPFEDWLAVRLKGDGDVGAD